MYTEAYGMGVEDACALRAQRVVAQAGWDAERAALEESTALYGGQLAAAADAYEDLRASSEQEMADAVTVWEHQLSTAETLAADTEAALRKEMQVGASCRGCLLVDCCVCAASAAVTYCTC